MKKVIPLIYILTFLIMIIFTINTSKTYAGRGCCSWHGGQAYCDTNTGRWYVMMVHIVLVVDAVIMIMVLS